MDKETLRQKNILLRKKLNQKRASKIIVSKILSFEPFLNSQNILIFYPLKFEINLLELLDISSKNFFLPKVNGCELLICPFSFELEKSAFGTMEPKTPPLPDISVIDLAFIPALAIDDNFNRLGYGKGFYDRLFSKEDFRAKKAAVLNKELVVKSIEIDACDKKVDYLITDKLV